MASGGPLLFGLFFSIERNHSNRLYAQLFLIACEITFINSSKDLSPQAIS
jgi:hypothetical protein